MTPVFHWYDCRYLWNSWTWYFFGNARILDCPSKIKKQNQGRVDAVDRTIPAQQIQETVSCRCNFDSSKTRGWLDENPNRCCRQAEITWDPYTSATDVDISDLFTSSIMVAWDTADVGGEVVQASGTIPALASFQRHGLDGLDLWPSWIRSKTVSRFLCRIIDIKFGCSTRPVCVNPDPETSCEQNWKSIVVTPPRCVSSFQLKGGQKPIFCIQQMTSRCFEFCVFLFFWILLYKWIACFVPWGIGITSSHTILHLRKYRKQSGKKHVCTIYYILLQNTTNMHI